MPNSSHLQKLEHFLHLNPNIQLHRTHLHQPSWSEQLNFGNMAPKELLPSLRALQRLLRIDPNMDCAKQLFHAGLHSAVQIASFAKPHFVAKYTQCFRNDRGEDPQEQAHRFYDKAVARKTQMMLQYMHLRQRHGRLVQTSPFLRSRV